MAIKHAFTSAKTDGGDATLVRPSDWNAAHILDAELPNKVLAGPISGTSAAPTFRLFAPNDLLLTPNWAWAKEDFMAGNDSISGEVGECGIAYSGSGSTVASNGNDVNHPGIMQRHTAATANTTVGLSFGVSGGFGPFPTLSNQVWKVTWIVENNSSAFRNFTQRVGIGNSMGSDPPSSGVYFENVTTTTPSTWTAVVNGSVTTTNTTSITIDQNWHRYDITNDGANNFTFSIDDVVAATLSANPATSASSPGAAITTVATEVKSLVYDYVSVIWQVTR